MHDSRCTRLPRLVKVAIAADAILATGCVSLLASDAEAGWLGAVGAVGALLWPTFLAHRAMEDDSRLTALAATGWSALSAGLGVAAFGVAVAA